MGKTLGLQLPFGIDPVNPVPVDSNYGPYSGLTQAKSSIPLALRYDGLTVQITGLGNYWWLQADLTDTGLIPKSFSGGTDTYVTGGTYNAGTAVFTNNTGGTFNVTGFTTGGTSFAKYTVTTGVTANTTSTITHNLATTDVVVQLIEQSNNELVELTVDNYQLNSVDVTSTIDINLRIVILAAGSSSDTDLFVINNQPSSYTLVLTDKDKLIEVDDVSPNTLLVPNYSSVPFQIGTKVFFYEKGIGQTTFSGDTGVTINSPSGATKLNVQYSDARLVKVDTNVWLLNGDIIV